MSCSDAHLGMRRVESLAMWVMYKYLDMIHERNKLETSRYDPFTHGLATGRFDESLTTLMGCLTGVTQGSMILALSRINGAVKGLPTDKAKAYSAWVLTKSEYVGSCL